MKTKKYASPKLKDTFDEKSTIPIKKGYQIIPTLSAWDKKWGRYHYPMRTNIHYALFLDMKSYYKSSILLLKKVREIKVGEKQNARLIFDEKLLDDIFLTASKYILSYYMALEYFVTEYLWVLNNVNDNHNLGFEINDNDSLLDRIRAIDRIVKGEKVLPASVNMIVTQRDFLMHPTFRRIFPTKKNKNWKENLIGWFLSGEIEGSFEELEKYLNEKTKEIEDFISTLPKKKIVLTVKRGLVAKESAKKLPKE